MWTERDYTLIRWERLGCERGLWDFTDGWYKLYCLSSSLSLFLQMVMFSFSSLCRLSSCMEGDLWGPFDSKSPLWVPAHTGVCVGVFDGISQCCSLCVCTFYPAVHVRAHTLKHTRNHTNILQTNRGVWQIRVCASQAGGLHVCVCSSATCLLSHFQSQPN